MAQYQQQTEGYQQGALALKPMANSVMQQGVYQPQAPVHQPMTHQLQHPVQLAIQQKNDGF
jgi:hypothetical protein